MHSLQKSNKRLHSTWMPKITLLSPTGFSQTGMYIEGASSFSRNCASLCPHPESLQPLPSSPSYYLSSIIPSFSIAVVLAASSGLKQLNLFHHEVLRKLNKNSIFTLFENYSKCRIWILAFFTNFCPFKTDLSGNTVWPQASGFQKLAKMNHFWHF